MFSPSSHGLQTPRAHHQHRVYPHLVRPERCWRHRTLGQQPQRDRQTCVPREWEKVMVMKKKLSQNKKNCPKNCLVPTNDKTPPNVGTLCNTIENVTNIVKELVDVAYSYEVIIMYKYLTPSGIWMLRWFFLIHFLIGFCHTAYAAAGKKKAFFWHKEKTCPFSIGF